MKKIALLLCICMLLSMVPASLAQELAEEVETVSVGGGDEELVTEFTGELDISAFVDEALENEVVELPEAVSVPERTGSDGEDNGEGGSGEAVESCADDEHVWDDGGKCTVCGYKCQHPNKSIREKTGEDFYQQIEGNNLSHILRWKVYDVGYCPDCKKKATITVKVVDPYKPTGVVINQGKSVTLKVGQSLKLSATLKPTSAKSKLTWSSGSKKVVTVNAQTSEIVAKKKGKAKITVKTANGKKATITVTVTK